MGSDTTNNHCSETQSVSVHGQTAAEVIVDRADHQKQTMGLTTWEAAPKGKIQRYDFSITNP